MTCFYSVFGLKLRANQFIPGLESVCTSLQAPDVEIFLGEQPEITRHGCEQEDSLLYASSVLSESGEPSLRVWNTARGSLLRLDYIDGTKFWLDRAGRAIWAIWLDTSSREDTATYLLGPVLGLLLRLRGVPCLHASAVAFGRSAVAFVGREGAGKSTTAAALARRGHAVISDDIVALVERDSSFFVLPAYPYLCLWPDSVKIVYGPDKTLPPFSQNWDKCRLALAENRLRFEAEPLALGGIYLLGERSAENAAPFVEIPAPREGMLALVADSYATNLVDANARTKEFELLGRLVATVPVLRLRPHQDAARIDRLCELIESSVANLWCQSSGPVAQRA